MVRYRPLVRQERGQGDTIQDSREFLDVERRARQDVEERADAPTSVRDRDAVQTAVMHSVSSLKRRTRATAIAFSATEGFIDDFDDSSGCGKPDHDLGTVQPPSYNFGFTFTDTTHSPTFFISPPPGVAYTPSLTSSATVSSKEDSFLPPPNLTHSFTALAEDMGKSNGDGADAFVWDDDAYSWGCQWCGRRLDSFFCQGCGGGGMV
jgi:hypothetical protein